MEGSMPVLHLVNGEFYAGAERVQDLLALALPENGYEVAFCGVKSGVFAERRAARAAPMHEAPMRSRLDLSQAFRIARIARDGNFRLIHTHTVRTALLGRLVSHITGLPMVHHVHSPTAEDTETGWRNLRNVYSERLGLAHSARLIAVSRRLAERLLERGISRDRVRTVWNGVPVRDRLRMNSVPGERLMLGTVALFRPRKGVEVLLEAIAHANRLGIDVHLRAVGPFETRAYEEEVRRLVCTLGIADRVHWTGFTSDVAAEYSKMHAFVLPSLYGEGLPMVVLEAMSCGLPVIATRIEGVPEVVREGVDGMLVEPGESRYLLRAIRRLASGEVDGNVMGDAARRRQREHFSDLSMAHGIAGVYDETLGFARAGARAAV